MNDLDLLVEGVPVSESLPGVSLASFTPDAPVFERKSTTLPYRNGILIPRKDNAGRYTERKISVELALDVSNAQQFYTYRHDIYNLFVREDPYYVTCTYEPHKRWLVTCDDSFSVQQNSHQTWGTITFSLTAVQGLSESIFNSLTPVDLNGEHYGLGMNVGEFDNPQYRFTNLKRFNVYNFGDVRLSPIEHDYNVRMHFEGKDIVITNKTTNQSVKLLGTFKKGDLLTLNKQYVIKGSSIVNKQGRFPTLLPGKNEFTISNATYSDLQFITHFYYK
ncbi:phage tail domain-containing protein [Bacillus velezensis]|uniref:phage tail domain-containing protein n=1 Tax=Bacillus velezensis TaxID=492670 RepID=UPI0019664658|nr:phage tail domain-containing protein [Bacillus velezensis]MBM7029461.1 phage tail family protein [Bacillus velezensis]